jgi:hypothetical protein
VTRSAVLVLDAGARREPCWGVAEEAWDGRDRLQQAEPGRGGSDCLPPPDARPPPGGRRSRLSCRQGDRSGANPLEHLPPRPRAGSEALPRDGTGRSVGRVRFPWKNFLSEARKWLAALRNASSAGGETAASFLLISTILVTAKTPRTPRTPRPAKAPRPLSPVIPAAVDARASGRERSAGSGWSEGLPRGHSRHPRRRLSGGEGAS